MTPWVLAVDFGTTNTAAAVCEVGQPARASEVKLSTASTVMPSAVLATGDELIAGEVAVNSWVTAPADSYAPTPKQRVLDGAIMLGGQRRDVAKLIAVVLTTVLRRAERRFNGEPPAQVRVTHPAKWAGRRLDVLRDAAARAQLPDVKFVPEPVAAAAYYAQRHAGQAGDLVAVYDLGGGTLDVAVLRRTEGVAYEVLATDGVDPLGGETFDLLLQQHVIDTLAERGDTELAELLGDGAFSPGERRSFLDSVRNAKHTLSDLPNAAVSVAGAGHATVVMVRRADFNTLIDPGLDLSVQAMNNCLRNAGVAAQDLDRLYLVGGSSYVQRVAERLTAELGITPATFDDPKLVTCLGALHHPVDAQPRPDGDVDRNGRVEKGLVGALERHAPSMRIDTNSLIESLVAATTSAPSYPQVEDAVAALQVQSGGWQAHLTVHRLATHVAVDPSDLRAAAEKGLGLGVTMVVSGEENCLVLGRPGRRFEATAVRTKARACCVAPTHADALGRVYVVGVTGMDEAGQFDDIIAATAAQPAPPLSADTADLSAVLFAPPGRRQERVEVQVGDRNRTGQLLLALSVERDSELDGVDLQHAATAALATSVTEQRRSMVSLPIGQCAAIAGQAVLGTGGPAAVLALATSVRGGHVAIRIIRPFERSRFGRWRERDPLEYCMPFADVVAVTIDPDEEEKR